jgi:hypothetical protein
VVAFYTSGNDLGKKEVWKDKAECSLWLIKVTIGYCLDLCLYLKKHLRAKKRYLIVEAMYNGKLTEDFERRVLNTYLWNILVISYLIPIRNTFTQPQVMNILFQLCNFKNILSWYNWINWILYGSRHFLIASWCWDIICCKHS